MNGIQVPDGFELIQSPFQGRVGPKGDRGLPGRMGPRPAHEVTEDGLYIRFQTQAGTWGEWIRMRGEQGLTGPMPAHQWDGSRLQFQQADGGWGPSVELQGVHYVPEIDNYRLRFVRTDEAPDVTAWRNIRGQKGARGPIPDHEVSETGRLRFQKPDGEWGEIIDIRALLEPSVQQGPPGPPPRHEINQATGQIRFEQPDGTWGEWLEFTSTGESRVVFMGGGAEGAAGGATPTAIPVTNWDPSTGTFPSGAENGQVFRATGTGTIDGVTFQPGDLLTGLTGNPSTTSYDDWTRTPHDTTATATQPLSVTALPTYASVQPFEYRLLVQQVDAADNGWWYADPTAGTWVQILGGAAGGTPTGVDEWTDLLDTDAALGAPGDLVAVNAAGNTLTFVDIDGGTF